MESDFYVDRRFGSERLATPWSSETLRHSAAIASFGGMAEFLLNSLPKDSLFLGFLIVDKFGWLGTWTVPGLGRIVLPPWRGAGLPKRWATGLAKVAQVVGVFRAHSEFSDCGAIRCLQSSFSGETVSAVLFSYRELKLWEPQQDVSLVQ